MVDIIILIACLLSGGVVLAIIFRKFSVLASLDMNSVPQEQQDRKKEDIVEMRLRRKIEAIKKGFLKVWKPLAKFVAAVASRLYQTVMNLEKKYQAGAESVSEAIEINQQKVLSLLNEADGLVKGDDLAAAEKKLIEVIGLDHRNLEAYKRLGQIYLMQKEYEHAIESLQHALKLDEKEAAIYGEISEVYGMIDDKEKALMYIKEAVKRDSKNPKYIDAWVEKSINTGDKFSAEQALRKLKKVNPENQKIKEYKQTVKEMKY